MLVLDTNPISVLERRGRESVRLIAYLDSYPADEIHVTVISYEEQIRGWMSALGTTRDITAQVLSYDRLLEQLENYCNLQILPFDDRAAVKYTDLRQAHRRASSPDLKIAAITLVHDATLITQNVRDFQGIIGLKVKNWAA